jgi:hypothetical protein
MYLIIVDLPRSFFSESKTLDSSSPQISVALRSCTRIFILTCDVCMCPVVLVAHVCMHPIVLLSHIHLRT